MGRRKRNFGQKRINHVIIRGINKQEIFFDDKDKIKFLKELRGTKEKYKYELFAYVLMPNHVHMQICDSAENLSKIMQALELGYTRYFNIKYKKTGPLFGDRYKNFPVDTEDYFIRLMRYIHRNPEKARIDFCEKYRWSSYGEYLELEETTKKIVLIDKEKCFQLLNEDRTIAINKFIELHQYDEKIDKYTELTEYEMLRKLTDEKVIEILKEEWKLENIQDIQQYNSEIRNELLKRIQKYSKISNQQLSRITGISSRLIDRVKQEYKNENIK